MGRLFRVLGPFAAIATAAIATCSSGPVSQPASADDVSSRRLTVFLIDGLQREPFEAELKAGNLPNIQKLIDGGAYVERGVTAFPSVTGFAYYPFLSGHDASQSGITGLRWFDRSRTNGNFRHYVGKHTQFMTTDLRTDFPILFELFKDRSHFSINNFINRGIAKPKDSGAIYVIAKFKDYAPILKAISKTPVVGKKLAPELETLEKGVMIKAVKNLATQDPKIQWLTLATPDAHYHLAGADPQKTHRYRGLLRNIDQLIGLYRLASKRFGREDGRIYAVVSDHGGAPVRRNIDLCKTIERPGFSCWRGPSVVTRDKFYKKKLAEWNKTDVIVAINGNNAAHVYFKGESWRQPPSTAFLEGLFAADGRSLFDVLLAEKGIEFIIHRAGDGAVVVRSAQGVGRIRAQGESYAYAFEGVDPLNYWLYPAASALVDGRFHPAAEWLTATAESAYPYAPVRLHRLMGSAGAGDLVITSQSGTDFGKDYEILVGNYKGGHGGLRADQMSVPFILSGPGVKKGALLRTAASEDIGATLFKLLGVEHALKDAKGRVLTEAIED